MPHPILFPVRKTILLLLGASLAILSIPFHTRAQPVITVTNAGSYSENFDVMGPAGNAAVPGWFVGSAGIMGSPTYGTNVVADNGSSPFAQGFNYGLTGNADRALGSLMSGFGTGIAIEAHFLNQSSALIVSFTLSYTGEQWRQGGSSASNDTLVLQYAIDEPGFTAMGGPFNFNTPYDTAATASPLDGNQPTNRVTGIGGTYTPASPLTNGQSFYLRWANAGGLGVVGHGMAIDDFTITFTLSNPPPVVVTDSASVIGSSATLNGSANPNGLPTIAWFEWGTTTNYGNVTPAQAVGAGTVNTNFSRTLTNLLGSTMYHFRAVASNSVGVGYGTNQSFTTPDLSPEMTTYAVSNLLVETARLWGSVNPRGSSSYVWFEWGTTTNYGNLTPILGPGVGTNSIFYSHDLVGLLSGTTYHFRAAGSNIHGRGFGTNLSFTTRTGQPPTVVTLSAIDIVGLTARLQAVANPGGATTLGWFEWGTTTNYGNITQPQLVGNGTTNTPFYRSLSALQPQTTYHFRALASNSLGVAVGTNRSFTIGPINVGLDYEPNDTPAAAVSLVGTNLRVTANIAPNGDVDYYSFSAQAGDRVYAALMVGGNNSGLSIIDSDGETVLEYDDDDGSYGPNASSIAGVTIPANGVYYVRVDSPSNGQIRPYDLWLRVQHGSTTMETEPNESFPGQALPPSGWVSGALGSTFDVDYYSIALNAGDTVFLSLDLDPERDGVEWNGQLGFGAFGTPASLLTANDPGVSTNDSEALFVTVKDAGTYGISVGLPPGGTDIGTYHLSGSVLPAATHTCTTYNSTDVPQTIPSGPGLVSSTLTIPDDKRVRKLKLFLELNHASMPDLDVSLTAPDGNTVGLFSDIGSSSQTNLNFGLDDDAGVPVEYFTIHSGAIFKAEYDNRLEWFRGQQAQGTWTLTLRDDQATNGGTLNGWRLVVCEDPPLVGSPVTIYSTDFESNDSGFTHSGIQDEWQRGLPSSPPIITCHSGVNCWKTDLATNYNANASNDLYSPNIDLTGVSPGQHVIVTWAMKFQIESGQFDHAFVEVQEVGGAGLTHVVWAWLGATMRESQGGVNIEEAAGWGIYQALINDFAGKTIRLRFHFDSDGGIQFPGWAIDDVSVKVYPSVIKTGNNIGMNFFGAPNRAYRVQYTTNLAAPIPWTEFNPQALFTAPPRSAFGHTDTNPPGPIRFYRTVPNP